MDDTAWPQANPARLPATASARWGQVLACVVEVPPALIVVAEALILGGGAFARYALHAPLPWIDEVASLLFVWLAILGAIIALRRGAHMQLTTFIKNRPPRRRAWLDAFGMWMVVAFLLLLLQPAWEHVAEHRYVQMPTLEISEAWRAGAILAGTVLMLVTAVIRLLSCASLRQTAVSGLAAALGAGALWLLSPALTDLGNANLVIFFLLMLGGCVAIGVPIAFAFGLATLCYLVLSTATPLSIIPNRMQEGMSHMILLAVPLFILLGGLIEMTGLARAMIQFLAGLIGHRRGGMQYVGDVHRFRHLRVKDGRHGRGGARTVPGDEAAGCEGRRPDRAAVGVGGDVGDDSAQHRADHGGVGDGRIDYLAVHRRADAGARRAGDDGLRGLVADAQGRHAWHRAAIAAGAAEVAGGGTAGACAAGHHPHGGG